MPDYEQLTTGNSAAVDIPYITPFSHDKYSNYRWAENALQSSMLCISTLY